MATTPAVYDESKITTLSSLEHIRLRPGMYIGRLGNGKNPEDGIYVLLKEIIDNCIDEFIMGHGKRIRIKLEEKTISIRDYGRGIPLGKVVDCVSIINTGAKYNDDVFQFSVGLNGVGTKAVNALASHFSVTSYRNGLAVNATFAKGKLLQHTDQTTTTEKNGTFVEFTADEEIFPDFAYQTELITRQLWNYAYLNRGLTLSFNKEKFFSKNGLFDLLTSELKDAGKYPIIHYTSERVEFAFTHTDSYGEEHFSFVNGQYTSSGGTHLSAFREGILKGVNEFFKTSYQGTDVREGIFGAISIRIKEPIFESQTKNKLGNTDIRSWMIGIVKDAVVDHLYKNAETTTILKNKIQMNERLRKELTKVKKAARENAKKTALTVPNLKDCKYHLNDKSGQGENSMIFLTEGQSAGGSMISSRNVYTQAIFCLKGKPLNCYGAGKEVIYKNQELYSIMKALGIEDSVEDLRYQKVIIATDADVDGLHIRNLLLTFFLQYFETLVHHGHIYLLETPLFRVRNLKKTEYCYSEKTKTKAVARLQKSKGFEITRFKGLGEISPKEFGAFIGEKIRLTQVTIEHAHEVRELLAFYMGSNTTHRKKYIMENLV